ncbi:MAG: hypothetical protein JXR71_05650 [Bacteroidales bacterium]|nr:hypothetical protein [Bacteroidales bacterium]
MENNIFILSGGQGEGKTTRLGELLPLLEESGIRTAGFVAKGSWEGGMRSGFTLADIQGSVEKTLCTTQVTDGWIALGRFYFDPEVILWGEQMLQQGILNRADLFVMDEMGKFELSGNVWHPIFDSLLRNNKSLLVTVRSDFITQFIEKYTLENVQIFTTDDDLEQIVNRIRTALK